MEKTHILQDITDNVNVREDNVTQKLTTDRESIKQANSFPSVFYETLHMVKYEENLSDDENALNTSDEESSSDFESLTSTPTHPTETILPTKARNGSTEYFYKVSFVKKLEMTY